MGNQLDMEISSKQDYTCKYYSQRKFRRETPSYGLSQSHSLENIVSSWHVALEIIKSSWHVALENSRDH